MNTKRIATLVLAVVVCAHGSDALAATKFWKNSAGSGNWNVSNNWSGVSAAGADNGGVPVAFEPVRIVHTDGTARSVTLNASTPSLGLMSIDLTGAGTASNSLLVSANNSLTAGGLTVGGHNGVAETNGRGTITQSNGTITTSAGLDLVVGNGVGSTGNYNLSGTGAVVANQSLYIGYKGNGTFTQTGGTTTLNASGVGTLDVGILSSATGTYNLSGGSLTANTSEYVGDQGAGVFNHSGGTNTIVGAGRGLTLGYGASGNGTYTASGSASLTVPGDVNVGLNGTGTLIVQGNANVHIGGALNIGASDFVYLYGGTLRFNGYSRNAAGGFNFTGGTLKLAGSRYLHFDSTIADLYGATPTIASGRNLTVEGTAVVGKSGGGTVTVSSANFTSQGKLTVGLQDYNGTLNINSGATVTNADVVVADAANSSTDFPQGTVNVNGGIWNTGGIVLGDGGQAAVNVTNGGYVRSSYVYMGLEDGAGANEALNTALVSGPGSTWISDNYFNVGGLAISKLTIENGANVYVTNELRVWLYSQVDMNGGTLRLNTLNLAGLGQVDYAGKLNYNGGTIQFAGNRNVGTDADIQRLYGFLPVIPTGKGLTIENTLTLSTALHLDGGSLATSNLSVTTGSLDFDGGIFELQGGTVTGLGSLSVPTGGEFKARGTYSFRVTGAADSIITATGNLTIGNSSAVNGFGTQGIVSVGANTVTLLDSNDAVFDSTALATLGAGASPGTLAAANGLTLDFGGNVTGYGTITTPNNIARPLINNGHITGNSAAQKITLSGYVKGVGTFNQVNFTGTYSPGLSPTTAVVGSLSFSPSSTLLMELGGTTAGSGYDQILASGALSLGGVLQISLINNFIPSAGQQFNILDWGSLAGTFSSFSLPTLSGLSWNTSQLYTTGVLSVSAAAGLIGDFNNDGYVDAADYVRWRKNTANGALPNDNGLTTQAARFNLWRANFGNTVFTGSGAESNSNVPEPSTSVTLVTALMIGLIHPACRRFGFTERPVYHFS